MDENLTVESGINSPTRAIWKRLLLSQEATFSNVIP